MDVNWSIVAAGFGFASARAALSEYRGWKARRTEIPLGFNARTGAYEPDLKLKKFERRFKIAAWALIAVHVALGFLFIANYPG